MAMIVAPLLLSGLLLIDAPSQPVAAQANEVVMFTFLGGVGGYDAMCEGYIRHQLGWLDDRTGAPQRIPAAKRIRVLSEIRGFGSFIVGLREVEAGFESAAVGATVANGRAYDLSKVDLLDAYNDAFNANALDPAQRRGGRWFHCGHGATHAGRKGGLLELDGGRLFAGFMPDPGTGVLGFNHVVNGQAQEVVPYGRPPELRPLPPPPLGVGTVTAHLHTCWSARDPGLPHPEGASVVRSLAVTLGAGNVDGHQDTVQTGVTRNVINGSPAQQQKAQDALDEAARTDQFIPDPAHPEQDHIAEWIGSLPFPAADSLPSGYSRAQDAIDQKLGAAGVVKLTLVYQAPEAEHPDPPGEAFAPGCVQADRILAVNSTGDDEDGDISDGICDTGNAHRGFTGSCTLRAALQEADQTNELDVIEFKIPGSGVPTIHIDHDKAFGFGSHGYLRPVIIDGFTQDAGMVEIDGSAAPSVDIAGNEIVGLDIVGTRGVVRGLVINRFPSDGIKIRPSGPPPIAKDNIVRDNLIGTDPTGSIPLGNDGHGVHIIGRSSNLILYNVIADNQKSGVFVEGADAKWNRIEGNVIGTNGTRSLALGNHDAGVWISSAGGNVVGGSAPRAGNVLAFNAGGVRVASGAHNAIVGNAILGSTGVPIDLQGGANSGMAAPTLTSAAPAGSATTIVGSFAGDPSASITLEFFASGTCDPSGFGPGEHAIGSIVVTTDVAGNAAYTATLPVRITGLPFITATATNENADTSGFSRCVALQTSMVPGDVDGDGSLTCADLARVRRALGKQTGQPGFDARADLNGDGVINVKDLAFVARLLPAGTRCQ